jgi:hypothetical protein
MLLTIGREEKTDRSHKIRSWKEGRKDIDIIYFKADFMTYDSMKQTRGPKSDGKYIECVRVPLLY